MRGGVSQNVIQLVRDDSAQRQPKGSLALEHTGPGWNVCQRLADLIAFDLRIGQHAAAGNRSVGERVQLADCADLARGFRGSGLAVASEFEHREPGKGLGPGILAAEPPSEGKARRLKEIFDYSFHCLDRYGPGSMVEIEVHTNQRRNRLIPRSLGQVAPRKGYRAGGHERLGEGRPGRNKRSSLALPLLPGDGGRE